MYKFSLVIPLYNVEDYIADCLKSLLEQSYNNFEIIIINDGSTDDSLIVAKSYEALFDSFKLITIDNSGLSMARNRGMEEATGDYIYFIDSDDCIPEHALKILSKIIEKENPDTIFFDALAFGDTSKNTNLDYERKISEAVFDSHDLFSLMLSTDNFVVSACCYVLKRQTFSTLRFMPAILHEDNLFTLNLILKQHKAYIIPEKLFYRRIRSGSITTEPKNIKHINGICKVIKEIDKMKSDYSINLRHNIDAYQLKLLKALARTFALSDERLTLKGLGVRFFLILMLFKKIKSIRNVKTFILIFLPDIYLNRYE